MKKLEDCIESDECKKFFFRQEMGKRFTLQSTNVFSCKIVDIDSCVFKNTTLRRCDYLFLVPKNDINKEYFENSKAYYVELKGINISYACEQLYNAIAKTKQGILNYDIEAKVIAVKGFQPKILNNEYFRKVKKMIKKEIVFHKVHKGNNFNHIELI
jgi:hypothetical protein